MRYKYCIQSSNQFNDFQICKYGYLFAADNCEAVEQLMTLANEKNISSKYLPLKISFKPIEK